MRNQLLPAALLVAAILLPAAPALADYPVTGTFQYEDREFDLNGFTGSSPARPIRFAQVRIMAGNTELARGGSDENGAFSINVPGSTAQDITAVCVTTSSTAAGLAVDVRVASDELTAKDLYAVSSASAAATGTAAVNIGPTTATADTDVGKAFNIWDVTVDAFEFVASAGAAGSLPTRRLIAIWRQDHARTGSFYQHGSTSLLFVGSTSGYDDTIISHEVGHYVDAVYSNSDSPGGTHFLGDDQQDIRLSWGEGLATFLGSSMRRFKSRAHPEIYVNTDGFELSFSYEVESLGGNVAIGSKTGSTNEVAVTAALWDITDGPGSYPSGTDDDPLQRPFGDVWKVLTQYLPAVTRPGISIENFWDGWFAPAIGNGFQGEMQTIFATVNGIEFIPDQQEGDGTAAAAKPTAAAKRPALAGGAKVVINEVDLGAVDALELYNAGDAEADLTGWTAVSSAGAVQTTYQIPAFKLAPGALVVLSEASGTSTSYVLYFNRNISWANGSSGSCALTNAAAQGVDYVRWGNTNQAPPTGTSFTGPNPASPPAGRTLGRNLAGDDTDAGADWTAQTSTFGSFNLSGQERHHTYYPEGDLDHGSFNATAGRYYLAESLNLVSGADTILEILAPDGATVLASNDDYGTTKASRLVWTAPANGKYYLRSRRFDAPSNFARYGSYDMRLVEGTSPFTIVLPALLTVSRPGQGGKYQTLSQALSAAANGDTVEILDNGTYKELPAISGKSITLKAARGKNPVLDGSGGSQPTLIISSGKSVTIDGLTIAGGRIGMWISGGSVTLVNSVISGASDPTYGDGIEVTGSGSRLNVTNSTIINNRRLGIGIFSRAAVKVVNCIVRGNALGDIAGDSSPWTATVKNSLVGSGGYAGSNGNISGDPQFVDEANNNFRLKPTSPAIDAGDPADLDLPGSDADGIPRSLDGKGDGTALPDMGAYEYLAPGFLSATEIFPQIAAGGSNPAYQTSIVGINVGAVAATVNLSLTRSNAEPFPITVLNSPEGLRESPLIASQGALRYNAAGNSFNLSIPPSGTVRIEAAGGGDVLAGYAKFLSSVPVNGTALFKTLSGQKILSEAGVGLSKPTKSFTVYIDYKNSAVSGYAVANFGANQANLNLTLRDKDGTSRVTTNIVLEPGEHIAEFAHQRFKDHEIFLNIAGGIDFEGSLQFSSDQSVAAVALRFDNPASNVFSTIPVLVDEAATLLHFPQVADGGGYRTNFILVNPSTTATRARLEFFASDGAPLSLPIGGQQKTNHEVPLNARGVARFITDGTSAGTRVGWVKVTSISTPQVAIGGSAIFQRVRGATILSEAGVASSPSTQHFTTYVESLGWAESGLAICNPNPGAVTITFNLRNAAGEVVARTSFPLPPLGHVARFISEWFPSGFGEFEGTLEVLATGAVSAVALRYDNLEQDVFATLPVIVIP